MADASSPAAVGARAVLGATHALSGSQWTLGTAATWPAASLHLTTDLGHRRILRDPDVLALATTFATAGLPTPTSDLVREVDRQLALDPTEPS